MGVPLKHVNRRGRTVLCGLVFNNAKSFTYESLFSTRDVCIFLMCIYFYLRIFT